jgi:hypothetical protein
VPWTATSFAGQVKLTAAAHPTAAEPPQSQTRSRPLRASALPPFLAHHWRMAASAMGGRQSSIAAAHVSLLAIPCTSSTTTCHARTPTTTTSSRSPALVVTGATLQLAVAVAGSWHSWLGRPELLPATPSPSLGTLESGHAPSPPLVVGDHPNRLAPPCRAVPLL